MLPGWRKCLFAVAYVWRINLHCALIRGVVGKASGKGSDRNHTGGIMSLIATSNPLPPLGRQAGDFIYLKLVCHKAVHVKIAALTNWGKERKREIEEGGREVLPQSWGVLGMKPSVLSLTLLCHKRHSFCLLNHDDMTVAFWVIF